MSSLTIYQYRVYCIEEATYVTTWGTTEPTLCPNNHSDRTINSSLTTIVNQIGSNTVTAEEPTYGYFQSKCFEFDIPAGATGDVTTHDVSWVGNILLWRSIFYIKEENLDDRMDVEAGPQTIVGVNTVTVSPGNTVINVNSTVIDYVLYRGLHIHITDGVNQDYLGETTAIDKINSQITVSNPTVNTFNSGSYIQMTVCSVENFVPCIVGAIKFADKGFKGQSLSAGTIMRLKYTNNNVAAKKIHLRLEYYLQD